MFSALSSNSSSLLLSRDQYPMQDHENPGDFELFVSSAVSRIGQLLKPAKSEMNRFAKNVNNAGVDLKQYSDQEIDAKLDELRALARKSGTDEVYQITAFALIREVSHRVLGKRHYDVQIMGGWAMMQGNIAEMETGEGKTLTATLPAAAAALAGIPTHVITVNPYLAERDAEITLPLYERLGLSVGVIRDDSSPEEKRVAYQCDITYCTNKQVAFDHLRDRMAMGNSWSPRKLALQDIVGIGESSQQLLMRGLCFAIVDEADSILIDEAVTPLVISESKQNNNKVRFYQQAIELAKSFENETDFVITNNGLKLSLTKVGETKLEELGEQVGGLWKSYRVREELILQALKAMHLFTRDKHYLIKDDKVQIIDEFTGRTMEDRSWESGLHQMIEILEGCPVTDSRENIARISYQRFFRRYLNLAGMSGTVSEVKAELKRVYDLNVIKIPTARPSQRKIQSDTIYLSDEEKWQALVEKIQSYQVEGKPILVGTRSVGASEELSNRLHQIGLDHQLLNARQDKLEAEIITKAGQLKHVTVATNMAGRGTDIDLPEAAKALGGLHVLMTERHESRRIDRQLIGRCGRQGDPGNVETFISLEDDIVSRFGSSWLLKFIRVLKLRFGSKLLARLAFVLAQKNAQKKSFEARVSVLKMDEYHANILAFSGKLE